jgi:acetyl esterase/lipase
MIIITILIIVLAAIAIAVGLWLTLTRHNPEVDVTSGADYILAWKERTTIDTRLGTVTGLSNGRVHAFLGLRYAQPPTGDRRFLAPVAVTPGQGTYGATAFPMTAMQSGGGLEKAASSQMSEDCLFLNIFTPSTEGAHRPVLFWIHGGAFIEGSASGYDGSTLAEQGDADLGLKAQDRSIPGRRRSGAMG